MNEQHYKTNKNYFTKSDILRPIAGVMGAIGFLCYFFGWGYISYILMSIFLPATIVIFIIGSIGNSSENDITDMIENKVIGLEEHFEQDKRYAHNRVINGLAPFVCEGHDYEDGLMIKRAKSGILRTEKYTKAIIYTLGDCLYITRRSFSLVNDELENEVYDIPWSKVGEIKIIRDSKTLSFKGKRFTARLTLITIERADGETVVLPIHDDIGSDEFVEKLCKLVSEKKAEAEK